MTTFFIALCGESRRRFLPLLVTSGLLLICTTAVAAEPSAQLPDVLTVENSDAGPAGLALYQPLPKQSITMPQISNWQDANTKVKELGGWMFYASEADSEVDSTVNSTGDSAAAEQPAKPAQIQHPKQHVNHHHQADNTPKALKDQQ